MMKELESGRKIRQHVEGSERPPSKVDNKLLKQIRLGVCLKPTQTNDRSKPFLEGFRKFRGQVTINEVDDINKIREDLQATKELLALEQRNREAQDREYKKLLSKIATLEAELEREKTREMAFEYGSNVIIATMETTPASEEAYVNKVKYESEESHKTTKDLEKKYLETCKQLEQAKDEIKEQKRQIQALEKRLAQVLQVG